MSVLNHCLVSVHLWHFLQGSVPQHQALHSSSFFNLKKTQNQYHFVRNNFKILIEPRIWWRTTTARPAMSGSASSHLAMDEASLKNQNQTNLGLINLTSDTSGSFNLIEIATCLFVAISGFYLLSWWCQQRKARKMQEIRHALASVRVDPEVSRCPVFEPTQRAISNQLAQPPPPTMYPGLHKTAAEQLLAEVMSKYS